MLFMLAMAAYLYTYMSMANRSRDLQQCSNGSDIFARAFMACCTAIVYNVEFPCNANLIAIEHHKYRKKKRKKDSTDRCD